MIYFIEQSKWNRSMLSQVRIFPLMLRIMTQILNSKLVIIWEYQNRKKNISAKINIPNWSEKVLVVKNIVLWTYVINDLNGEEIALKFHKKESPKTNQRKFRIEKVIRKKGNKLYLKWTDYDNTFNNWIDMNDVL